MSTKSETTTSQTSNPWSVQTPYLQQAFQGASDTLNKSNANTYTGPQVAGLTHDQISTFQKMIGYGNNSTIPQQTADASGRLASAGTDALTRSMSSLNGFSTSNPTQQNIADATAYANNPATDGMIDAAMRDARRSVSEQALPQIARDTAADGNTMSSRRAISEGIVERGLADKTADTSANIRGQQFQQGLQLAENARSTNQNASLDAMKSAGSLGANAASTGINGLGSALTQQGGLFDIANQGGAGIQAGNQSTIDNNKGMAEYANGNAWDNLQKFYGIVGNQNWGGTQTGTQTSSPSIWNVIGGLMSSGGSLVSGIRGVPSK